MNAKDKLISRVESDYYIEDGGFIKDWFLDDLDEALREAKDFDFTQSASLEIRIQGIAESIRTGQSMRARLAVLRNLCEQAKYETRFSQIQKDAEIAESCPLDEEDQVDWIAKAILAQLEK